MFAMFMVCALSNIMGHLSGDLPTTVGKLFFRTFFIPCQFVSFLLPIPLEIREQGIVSGFKLLRWGNIEAYELTSPSRYSAPPNSAILTVRLRHVLKALPPKRLRVPLEKRSEIEVLLSRYLSDWPTNAAISNDASALPSRSLEV